MQLCMKKIPSVSLGTEGISSAVLLLRHDCVFQISIGKAAIYHRLSGHIYHHDRIPYHFSLFVMELICAVCQPE